MKKIIIIISSFLIVLITGGLYFVGSYFVDLSLNPHSSKEIIFGSDEETEEEKNNRLSNEKWLLETVNTTEEYITSFDDLKLHGYKILNEEKTNKWIISVHGYTGSGKGQSEYAKYFYEMGYNVLLPDLRAHGESEGDYIGMGYNDRLDIVKWIDKIIEEDKDASIILHGVSMGSGTVMMTSGENLPQNVKAVIADCGYTSVWEQFSYQLKTMFDLRAFPVMHVSTLVGQIKAGYSIKDATPLEAVKISKLPILFIHGDKDDFVPYYMMEELYEASSSSNKKMITVKDAGHADANNIDPKLYWSTVYDFIKENIE